MPPSTDGPEPAAGPPATSGSSLWLRLLPIALLVLLMAAVFASGLHRELALERLLARREQLQGFISGNFALALLAFMGVYVAAVTLSIPGAVFLTIFSGFLFGWLVGGIAAVVSATIGAVGIFLIARTSIGDFLLKKAGGRLETLAKGFQDDAFSYILFMRLVPVIPFWLTNIAPALFGVRVKTFALATLIGVIPGTLAFATAGAGLDSLIGAQQEAQRACQAGGGADCGLKIDFMTILTPQLLAAFAALGVVALIPVVVRRWFGHRLQAAGGGKS